MNDYSLETWKTDCPQVKCRQTVEGLIFVLIPASMGDDSPESPVAPKPGAYSNAIVVYEANDKVYIYSAEGVPVLMASDAKAVEDQIKALTIVVNNKANISDLAQIAFSGNWADLFDKPETFTTEGWADLWL